jgi:hypothetical protein
VPVILVEGLGSSFEQDFKPSLDTCGGTIGLSKTRRIHPLSEGSGSGRRSGFAIESKPVAHSGGDTDSDTEAHCNSDSLADSNTTADRQSNSDSSARNSNSITRSNPNTHTTADGDTNPYNHANSHSHRHSDGRR